MVAPEPLRVGLVGAGPWARLLHAPMLAASPRTELAGVWARRRPAAEAVAAAHGAPSFETFDELCDRCDALAFSVPPDVQATLAAAGAAAGKALLLEKPVAGDVAAAERLTAAVDDAGVVTQVVLTWRYADTVRDAVAAIGRSEPLGGRGVFINGALLGGPFATPWRLEQGPLLDLGPHVLDLLEACLGPIVAVTARGQRLGWISLLLEHDGGLASEAALCGSAPVSDTVQGVEIATIGGLHRIDTSTAYAPSTITRIVEEFADAVQAGRPHSLDVHHGLHLQRLIEQAAAQLR